MNEWLKDELANLDHAKRDQAAKEKRLELIRQHTSRFWESLKILIKDAADQMNQIPELKERVGGLDCMAGYTDRIEVTKAAYGDLPDCKAGTSINRHPSEGSH